MSSLKRLTSEIAFYKALASDPCVPRASKWLLTAAVTYLVSPIDLIPDFIPVLGQLDDLIIVPLLVFSALSLVPKQTRVRIRNELKRHP